MKKAFYFLFLLLITNHLFSQENELIGKWTNGLEYFWSEIYNDSLILFEGGNLHEGGSVFSVIQKPDKQFYIWGRYPEDKEHPSIGEIGNTVSISIINNKKCLFVKNSNNEIIDFLISNDDKSLKDIIISNIIKHELSGIYLDNSTGDTIIFYPDKQVLKGFSKTDTSTYRFGYEFDYPEIILVDSIALKFSKSNNQLLFYKVSHPDYDNGWKAGILYKKLKKTHWFNISNNKNLKGKYQFASTQILIDGILNKYSSKELRIMRNEIFARHGYIFKTPEIKEYFEKQDWYKAQQKNVNNKLSELERLNIQLIKRFEKIMIEREQKF